MKCETCLNTNAAKVKHIIIGNRWIELSRVMRLCPNCYKNLIKKVEEQKNKGGNNA